MKGLLAVVLSAAFAVVVPVGLVNATVGTSAPSAVEPAGSATDRQLDDWRVRRVHGRELKLAELRPSGDGNRRFEVSADELTNDRGRVVGFSTISARVDFSAGGAGATYWNAVALRGGSLLARLEPRGDDGDRFDIEGRILHGAGRFAGARGAFQVRVLAGGDYILRILWRR